MTTDGKRYEHANAQLRLAWIASARARFEETKEEHRQQAEKIKQLEALLARIEQEG